MKPIPAGALLAALLAAALLLLHRNGWEPMPALAVAPLVEWARAPEAWIASLRRWIAERERLARELEAARAEAARLGALTGELRHLRRENRNLRRLLSLPAAPGYRWLGALRIGATPDGARLILKAEGAAVDDAVVDADGLVGVVVAASGGRAVARTILDGSVTIPATDAAGRLAALVHGEGRGLRVDLIPRERAPKVGAILYTSGAGGLIPEGLPVARVRSVTPVPGTLFVSIRADPVADWRAERWLAVAHRLSAP